MKFNRNGKSNQCQLVIGNRKVQSDVMIKKKTQEQPNKSDKTSQYKQQR